MEPASNLPPADEKNPDERARREKSILEKANAIKFEWRGLISAFNLGHAGPNVGFAHRDYMLREALWMAEDFCQERIWKQALAVRIAQEAAQFDRSKLKPTKTKVLESIECAEFGRVVGGVEAAKDAEPEPLASTEGTPDFACFFPLLPYFYCPPHTFEAICQNLEDEDVSRLARHSKARQAYDEMYDAARCLQPPSEDDLPSSSKKALAANATGLAANVPASKRKMKVHNQSLAALTIEQPELEDDMGLGPSSLMAGATGVLKSARRMGELESTREKRKRKTREFNDEEEYMPGAKNNSIPRDRFPPRTPSQLLARAEITTSGGTVSLAGTGRVSGGMPSSNNLRHAQRPKTSTGKPGASGMAQMDSMQNVPSGSNLTGTRGSYGSRGPGAADRLVTWSVQDDHVLAAIVTEFGLNWQLVADVLRSYSTMAGQYRRPDACKARYTHLKRIAAQEAAGAGEAEGGEMPPQPPPALNMLVPLMNKTQARDALAIALPVHADVLKRHQAMLAALAARLKSKRAQEKMQLRENHKFRSEQHPSHYKILQSVNQVTGSKTLSPLDIDPIEQPTPPPQMANQASGSLPHQQQLQQQPQQQGQQPPHQPQGSVQPSQMHHGQPPMQQQQQPPQQQHGQMHAQQQGDGVSPPQLQLGNVMVGGSPTFGMGQQQGQGQGQAGNQMAQGMGGPAGSHAGAQAAGMAVGNRGKPAGMPGVSSSGALQQQQPGGMMGGNMMGAGMSVGGGMHGGAQPGAGGPGNSNMGMPGMNQQMQGNAGRSSSPSMNFNNLNQQQKNMLQQLGRQGGMQQGGMMRPPLTQQQQQAMAAAAAAGRVGGNAAGQLQGGAMSPALAAQIQKGLMQQAANNPAALQAIQSKMMAAAAAQQQPGQQGQQQPGQQAQQGQGGQAGQQQQPGRQMPPNSGGGNAQNPMLQSSSGFGMQLGGTGGVGFGLPQNNTAPGMNLQQQYLAQAASMNAAPRSQPSNQGGNS